MRRAGVLAAIAVAALLAGQARSPSASVAGLVPAPAARGADAASDTLIHADSARAAGFTGKGVTVAVVDTGIDERNPDLADAVVAEHCFVPPDGCPNGAAEQDGPGSGQDDQGHGTEVAGVITGNGGTAPVGVAPEAKLVVVKVTDRNGRTSTSQIIAGLNWILRTRPEVRIVNVSLAGDILLSGKCDNLGPLVAYGAVVAALRARGTLVFAPTGNNGSRFSVSAPACFHATVAVGAVYSQDFGPYTVPLVCKDPVTGPDQIACFSNTSSELDLLAPGAPIQSTALGGGRSDFAGTSAASAEAAAAAAVLMQADPTLSADQVEAVLEKTGAQIGDPRSNAATPRVDITAALSSVLGRQIPILPPAGGTPPAGPPTLGAPTVPVVSMAFRPVSFGSVRVGRTARRTLAIRNTGNGYLTVRVSSPAAPFTARPAKLLIAPGGRAGLSLSFSPARAGSYSRPLRLTTDDRTAAAITLPLRGSGVR